MVASVSAPESYMFAANYANVEHVSRGVHGHTVGSRPWAWAENNIEQLMANVVGNAHLVSEDTHNYNGTLCLPAVCLFTREALLSFWLFIPHVVCVSTMGRFSTAGT